MLESFQGLARKLYPLRYGIIALAFAALGVFVFVLLSGSNALDIYLLPAVSVFSWCVALYGIATTFIRPLVKIESSDGFALRFRKRISIALAWFWSMAFMVVTVLLCYLTYKTFSMALSGI